MVAPGDAPLAGSGSWFTLISGVAAGEPSGGGEGLLFPFSGALSLQKDKRMMMSVGPRARRCGAVCEHPVGARGE